MNTKFFIKTAFVLFSMVISACSKDYSFLDTAAKPLSVTKVAETVTTRRWIVLSDVHLGDSRSVEGLYSWNINKRYCLVRFLDALLEKKNQWEDLVLNGDTFEEWVCPADISPLADANGNILTQRQFLERIIRENKEVFDALYRLHDCGKRIHFIPGNHDMQVTAEDLEALLPSLFISHFDHPGVGAYTCPEAPEIYVEHSHRYDIYNAPYPLTYPDGTSSILPPGFFISRYACDFDNSSETPSSCEHSSTKSLVATFETGFKVALMATCKDRYRDLGYKVLVDYDDNLPYEACGVKNLISGRDIYGNSYSLYNNPSGGWGARCKALGALKVPDESLSVTSNVLSPALESIAYSSVLKMNKSWAAPIRICVWGHSHYAALSANVVPGKGKVIYANSGCWCDDSHLSIGQISASYVLITKTDTGFGYGAKSNYTVALKRFTDPGFSELLSTSLSVSRR